jgi:outer membrane protein OmpA-like peptidoglycan-associated protein
MAELGTRTERTDTTLTKIISADVLFGFNEAVLSDDADGELRSIADAIQSGGSSDVSVTGHTDSKGSHEFNQTLSVRRAWAVVEWLRTSGGLGDIRYSVSGEGETDPVADNENADGSDNEEGRRRNRRVEVRIEKP